jgi:hypothetical protein
MAKIHMVTVAEFVAAISGITRKPFAGLCGCTVPKLTVKDRVTKTPWEILFPSINRANVRKITNSAVLCGPEYKKMVEAELEREGKDPSAYMAGKCWHEAVPGAPLLRRNKKNPSELYFWAAYVGKAQRADGSWIHLKPRTRFVDITTGTDIPRDRLVNFLDVEHTPSNQGVDDGREVIVRTYKLESIRSLTVNGKAYVPIMK